MIVYTSDCPRLSPPMDPRAALEAAFPTARVCDDGSGTFAMALLDGEVFVVQVDPDGATAHRHRLGFAAVAAGRDPGEALAGLGLGARRAA